MNVKIFRKASLLSQSCLLTVFSALIISVVSSIEIDEHCNAASKFKSPNEDTPPNIAAQWREADESLKLYVQSRVPAVLNHTGAASFDEHLEGVQAVLRYWESPERLTNAALFHSLYGTEGFQGFSLPLSERVSIKNLIGADSEKLVFLFCMVDRFSLDKTVFAWKECKRCDEKYTLLSRPELGRFEIVLNKEEWLDFLELSLADWLEQVEGAAAKANEIYHWEKGYAYAYRRLAYEKMSEILAVERALRLSKKAPVMLAAVMATEPLETRNLVQMRTPPVSEAAKLALEAMRSNGDDIPTDFSLQPMTNFL